ncbi:LOW QUALITY PROTEIN: glutamic acid-rich protein-like [Chelonus insularis]|uniref:LOW QUALITY PROTEIN: glutamic acid-rich protein-like n=1 Tax=Chelonus insularis TaxID=460826 RepID=UPI00158A6DAE|nr:LOW QUALITY PROTEIN: glutamic acid-rich protein-like [Chelonus insularis]
MEVKGKKRKAGKLEVNGKLHENGKPPAKKNKTQKEKKIIEHDDQLQNGSTMSQSNKKMKKKLKQSGMNKKKEKDVVTVKSEVIEQNTADMETEEKLPTNRAERRRESGQYKPEQINLNEEQLKERIENISNRQNLSKTARRKLAVFKKKLQILQGTYVKRPPPTPSGLTKTAKRNLRKKELQKRVLSMLKNEDDGNDVTEKAIRAAKTVKGLKVKSNESVSDERFDKKKGNAQNPKKKLKTEKIKIEPEENIEIEEIVKNEESDQDNEEVDEKNEESGQDDEEVDENNEESDQDEEESDEDNEESDANDIENDDEDEEKVPHKSQLKKKAEKIKQPPKSSDTKNGQKKTRFVLFVGNLPYTTTTDDIKKHFLTKVSDVTSVRIPLDQKTKKPRGIAYVEFNNHIDYEKGLSLHHSQISGRRINVLYSQSGSKTVSNRPNVVAKNKKLHALRKQGKLAGSVKQNQKRSVRRNKQKNKDA